MELTESNLITALEQDFRGTLGQIVEQSKLEPISDSFIHNNGAICREGGDLAKLEHELVDGLYLRRMILNKGTVIISAIHKRDHVWFLLSGSITVVSKNGTEKFSAPWVNYSESGSQRVIYADENSVFQNIFKNPKKLTYLDDLEEYNYCNTEEEYLEYINKKEI